MIKYNEIVIYKCKKCGKKIKLPRHELPPKDDRHEWEEINVTNN